MKKVYQYEYDNYLKSLEELEKELAEVRKYKGDVAIYQGDNWHDNPILYQTELKETALMARIKKLKEKISSLEIIKERDKSMISTEDILNPNLLKGKNLPSEQKIQIKEKQNYIIKYPIDSNIYVDAVTGSGIEDILLYRISYLILSSNNKVDSEDILLINPNDNYSDNISKKSSKFITEEVEQQNIIEFTNQYLNEKLSLYKTNDYIENLKLSLSCKDMIDKFMESYLDGGIVTDDLKIDDQVVFNKDEIKKALFNGINSNPNYNWACMYFINKLKNNYEQISDKLIKKYSTIYNNLPFDDPIRKENVAKATEVRNLLKTKGTKIIKAYFKKLDRKVTEIYAMFIGNLNRMIACYDSELLNFQSETLKSLKKRKVTIGDIAALIYIRYLMTGRVIEKKHVILNEVQNYNEFLVFVLNNICSNCGITIFSRDGISNLSAADFEKVILDYKYENDDIKIVDTVVDSGPKIKRLKSN